MWDKLKLDSGDNCFSDDLVSSQKFNPTLKFHALGGVDLKRTLNLFFHHIFQWHNKDFFKQNDQNIVLGLGLCLWVDRQTKIAVYIGRSKTARLLFIRLMDQQK